MKICERITITKRASDGTFYGEKDGKSYAIVKSHELYPVYDSFYNLMRTTNFADRAAVAQKLIDTNRYPAIFGSTTTATVASEPIKKDSKEILMGGLQRLMEFFTEFSFVPSFRFTNTLAYMACQSVEQATTYVNNYFALMDSSYVKEVQQKTKSFEFTQIIKDIAQFGEPKAPINTRFKIYFGPQGTGKTVTAQKEADNRCIVCNSSMLPSDLMEDFIFKDGNPDFNPSLLWDCMEQGKTLVLDEINLLPFDSLRFLQGLVDGKTEFYYKNRPVHIHDGFQIIGTMNLAIGGMTYGLPEPLVDRCCDMKEFSLTAQQLAKAIMGME